MASQSISFVLPSWLKMRVQAYAERHGLSISGAVRDVLTCSIAPGGWPWWVSFRVKPSPGRAGLPRKHVSASIPADIMKRLEDCEALLSSTRDPLVTLMWGELTRSDVVRLVLATSLDDDGFLFTEKTGVHPQHA